MLNPTDVQTPAIAPWDYQPSPPFQVGSSASGQLLSRHNFETLQEAAAWFVRFQLGPIVERSAIVIDTHQQILVGYMCYPALHGPTQWFGTEVGFRELANWYDATMVGIWESEAKARVTTPEAPQDIVP